MATKKRHHFTFSKRLYGDFIGLIISDDFDLFHAVWEVREFTI